MGYIYIWLGWGRIISIYVNRKDQRGWNVSIIWGLKVVERQIGKMNIGVQYSFMDFRFEITVCFAL